MSWSYFRGGAGIEDTLMSDVSFWEIPAYDTYYANKYASDPSDNPGGGNFFPTPSGTIRAWVYRRDSDDGEVVSIVPAVAIHVTSSMSADGTEQSVGGAPTVTGSGPVTIGGTGPTTITSTGAATPSASVSATPSQPSGVSVGTVAIVAVAALGVAWAAGWLK